MAMAPGAWASDDNKTYLKDMLSKHLMRVHFQKRDGTFRDLICTRKMSLIPEENHPKGVKKDNPNTLPVWSFVDEGWRSFRFDTINHVTLITEISEDGKTVIAESGCRTGVILN